MASVRLILGDITTQEIDAIVNAANTSLLGGGGVDGAIHRAAGPRLLEECRKLGGCPTGQAKITTGGNLPASFVIHTVGPIWRGGRNREDQALRDCYLNSMKLAEQNAIRTIAFPSISTGAYGFPIERAARIAVSTVRECLARMSEVQIVLFVCFSQSDYDVYREVLERE
ncbi:MAG: O-acetyl-ADP-ribose deacetylase [Candidatus Bathyarchaeia archaeon]